MSAPGTPSRRQSQVADTLDDEEEDEALLPDSEKTKDDGQNAEGDADDDIFFEDDEMAKQAAFSAQVTDDMKLMHDSFDAEQSERLSLFRGTAFKSAALKRVLGNVGLNNPNTSTLPLIGGVAKVFVAEMVEKAREIQKAQGDTGPLAPAHLREAYRQFTEENGQIGPSKPMKGKMRFVR